MTWTLQELYRGLGSAIGFGLLVGAVVSIFNSWRA